MKKSTIGTVALASLVVLVGLTSTTNAGIIVEIANITSDDFDNTGLSNLSQPGFGMNANYSYGDDYGAYLAGAPFHDDFDGDNSWTSDIKDGSILIELASKTNVLAVAIVNGNAPFLQFETFSVEASMFADSGFTQIRASGGLATNDDLNLFSYDVVETEAKFLRINLVGNNAAPGSDVLGEIVVEGTALDANPVPEPATIAIWSLIGGVGLIGYRRRKMSKKA